ncbi:MAG: TadE/TadG family type IV pilus assembly protein [Acidimicrobiia bacterium]
MDRSVSWFRRLHGPERGAAMVEFALVLPVIVMVTFAMITSGIAYNHKMDMTHAAREGARYGATLPLTQCGGSPNPCGTSTWAQVVRSVVVERAMGAVTAADVCVALVHGSSATASTPTSSYSTGGAVCFAESGGDSENRVQVRITKGDDKIDGVFFQIPVTLTTEATAKFEE